MSRPFRDFTSMVVHTRKGVDWELFIKDPGASALIAAIHGGGIEPLTSELATAIAGDDHNLYDLRGIRETDNDAMRIPIIRFSEMRFDYLVRNCRTALHIEGSRDEDEALVLGGANAALVRELQEALSKAGFKTREPVSDALLANSQRFFNQCPLGGVQIEVPVRLRQKLVTCGLDDPAYADVSQRTALFDAFVGVVRGTLDEHLAVMRTDLDTTLERFERSTYQFPLRLRQQPQPGAGGHHHRAHDHDDAEPATN